VLELYDQIVNPDLLIRRITIATNHVLEENKVEQQKKEASTWQQMDLFTDYEQLERQQEEKEEEKKKERKVQEALLDIKKKYGKNAIIKGVNLEEGATGISRNRQIGGHRE
jgi:DNA polymerase V